MQTLAAKPFEVEAEFRRILREEDLYSVFQPIIDLRRHGIFGYEALIRGPRGPFANPVALFSAAALFGLESELEILCRKNSIQAFAEQGLDARLFLNISPGALLDPRFRKGRTLRYLREVGLDPERVVLEVTEYQHTPDVASLGEALAYYRDLGFKVALDDLGEGHSSLRLWTAVLPDYIKIDKHFIRDIHRDPVKARFMTCLNEMAAATGCQVIAEGVEEAEECRLLCSLGLPYAQGFYFAHPQPRPARRFDPRLLCFLPSDTPEPPPVEGSLASITRCIAPQAPGMLVKKVLEHFQQQPEQQWLPIVEQGRALGLVERNRFFNLLMETPYGVELYGKHPIERYLNRDVVQVEASLDLDAVSQKLTQRASADQAFLVTRDGAYHGVATVLDLLENITEQKIQSARHANPLTLLPGAVPMNRRMNALLGESRSFAVLYFDLDNFKPYNDSYGYDAGDRIIQLLARLLVRLFPEAQAQVGHIGGDDFIVLDGSGEHMEHCAEVLRQFAAAITDHYSLAHLAQGGIQSKDRQGRPAFHPLLSVSAGVVPPEVVAVCRSHIALSDLASEAKKLAKERGGSSWFVNHRAPQPELTTPEQEAC